MPLVRLVFFEAGQGDGQPRWLEIDKSAANLGGHDVGDPRRPFVPLQGPDLDRLHDILSQMDVLVPVGAA